MRVVAQFLLTPGGPVPGECLALNGSSGWVDIRLRQPIEPSALSYEHVPASINYDSSSAPLRISVVRACPLHGVSSVTTPSHSALQWPVAGKRSDPPACPVLIQHAQGLWDCIQVASVCTRPENNNGSTRP